jgi:hypothetical protein
MALTARGMKTGCWRRKAFTGMTNCTGSCGNVGKTEISLVNGMMTGCMRFWADDGMLYGQRYYFNSRPISKKAYLQKCERMPDLPRFQEEKTANTLGNYVRKLRRARREQAKLGPTPEVLQQQKWFDERCKLEIRRKSSKELLAWLTTGTKQEKEAGEMSKRQALQFARKLYSVGAVRVWATDVERDEDGAEYSRRLIIALPKLSSMQGKIYELCADPARPNIGGGGAAIHMGKKYMCVSLM